MQPLLKDQALLRAAVEELQAYLLSNELYWQMTPLKQDRQVGRLLSLTPGNLMLSIIKVKHYPWSEPETGEAQALLRRLEGEIARWRSAWRKKIEREMAARLKQWQDYLAESSTDKALIDYPFKVRSRAILDCFEGVDGQLAPAQATLLFMLDERLKGMTREAAFIWEPEVANGFAPGVFWYLYRAPVKG